MLVCEKKKKTVKVKRKSPKIQRGKYIFNTFPIKMVNTAFRLLFLVFFFICCNEIRPMVLNQMFNLCIASY